MRFAIAMILGGLVGSVVGCVAGAYLGCVLWPASNLCGLVGIFIMVPVGLAGGGLAGRAIVRTFSLR